MQTGSHPDEADFTVAPPANPFLTQSRPSAGKLPVANQLLGKGSTLDAVAARTCGSPWCGAGAELNRCHRALSLISVVSRSGGNQLPADQRPI